MKSIFLAASATLAAASGPGLGEDPWTVVLKDVRPAGPITGRLTFERRPSGMQWHLECRDQAAVRSFDGVAPLEAEWVMGEAVGPGGGKFTLALRGAPLWMSWIRGCPGMSEPEVIVRTP